MSLRWFVVLRESCVIVPEFEVFDLGMVNATCEFRKVAGLAALA
jgi:hypothetical protein